MKKILLLLSIFLISSFGFADHYELVEYEDEVCITPQYNEFKDCPPGMYKEGGIGECRDVCHTKTLAKKVYIEHTVNETVGIVGVVDDQGYIRLVPLDVDKVDEASLCKGDVIHNTIGRLYNEKKPCSSVTNNVCNLKSTCESIEKSRNDLYDNTIIDALRRGENCEYFRPGTMYTSHPYAKTNIARCEYFAQNMPTTPAPSVITEKPKEVRVQTAPTVTPKTVQLSQISNPIPQPQIIQHVQPQVITTSNTIQTVSAPVTTTHTTSVVTLTDTKKAKIQSIHALIGSMGYTKNQVVPLIQGMMKKMDKNSEKYMIAEYLASLF